MLNQQDLIFIVDDYRPNTDRKRLDDAPMQSHQIADNFELDVFQRHGFTGSFTNPSLAMYMPL